MSYELFLSQSADNFLNKLETNIAVRIRNKLLQLKENPELGKPLAGRLIGVCASVIIEQYTRLNITNCIFLLFRLDIERMCMGNLFLMIASIFDFFYLPQLVFTK